MSTSARDRLAVVALVATEIVAVVVLHALASQPWAPLPPASRWWEATDPRDLVLGLVRLGALAGAWWSLTGTVLYACARGAGLRRLAQGLARLQLAAMTRVVDRAVAGSLLLATSATPLAAAASAPPPGLTPPSPTTIQAETPIPSPSPTPEGTGARGGDIAPPGLVMPGTPSATTHDETSLTRPGHGDVEHVVAAGEHLWSIARDHLAGLTAREPGALSVAEIAVYWRAVVTANRDRIHSGDPDLIFPGERIELPPP